MTSKGLNMRGGSHTYEEDFKLAIEYTYNKEYKKVYNIDKLKRKFDVIIESYKNKKK
tara:strand:- start:908 stop:1078 length:171 start_codon:yes stop_codon:yes gene_type:complete